jgi:hypothetical protein
VPAALAAAAALLIAIVALSSGGGSGKPSSSPAGKQGSNSAKKKHQPSAASQAQSGGGSSATPAPAAPAPAAPSGTGGDTSSPTAVVSSFYKTSIDDPHAAYQMGSDNLHKQITEQDFTNQESTLKSIDFPQLTVTSQSGNAATVTFKSIARHTTKTDHCSGTISVVRGANGWLVDQLHVAGCTSGPPS